MIDLANELKENEVLVVVCNENYLEVLSKTTEEVQRQVKKVGYISLNKPFNVLKEIFKKSRINFQNIFFIDAITRTVINRPKPIENGIFVSSPHALTELNIAVSKACEHLQAFIFDSLSALLVYESGPGTVKFVHSLVNCFRTHKTKAIFIISKTDYEGPLMKDLKMFADKIIKF